MKHETQRTISDWARETFGEPKSNLSVAIRANEEMAEMLACLNRDDGDQHAAEEAADIIITLAVMFDRLGIDMVAEINRKMRINRERQWRLDGQGHGYHL
ncbi:MAG: nucleotide pyrophosphohydrolase [Planctomycetes bacterium]|nr:nucleotide pyrophosphohydrolase [Planctomycetota bacterium]